MKLLNVYYFLDMPLTAQAEAAVLNWEKNNPRDKRGLNKYSAEAIRTTEDAIRKSFAPYKERFADFV